MFALRHIGHYHINFILYFVSLNLFPSLLLLASSLSSSSSS
ncbi:hypothetical protein E2C01_060938 [Portunus trituberculatus]|uniref:Uncharacterized protein n=1 Tax=Portunus trituberculatus TaxID=210409 RepID=A0A5B7HAZ5_PORTR|nr:hypothetical protein [Portunus trituberculatus]